MMSVLRAPFVLVVFVGSENINIVHSQHSPPCLVQNPLRVRSQNNYFVRPCAVLTSPRPVFTLSSLSHLKTTLLTDCTRPHCPASEHPRCPVLQRPAIHSGSPCLFRLTVFFLSVHASSSWLIAHCGSCESVSSPPCPVSHCPLCSCSIVDVQDWMLSSGSHSYAVVSVIAAILI